MPIEIRLHGFHIPPTMSTLFLDADGSATLFEMLNSAGCEAGTYSVLVLNGQLVDAQAKPQSGDLVDVYAPLAGG